MDPSRLIAQQGGAPVAGVWAPLIAYLEAAAEAGDMVRVSARPEYLTPAEAARRLAVSRSTISRRIASGEIASVKIGAHHRIPVREFERFRDALLATMVATASPELEAELYGE